MKKQGVEMREKKMRHKIAGVENAGMENAAQEFRGGKCGKVACDIKLNRHKVNDKRVE